MKHLIISLIIFLISSSPVYSQLTNENLREIISSAKNNKLKFKVKYKNKKIIVDGKFFRIEEQKSSKSISNYLKDSGFGIENWIVIMESGYNKIICLMNEENVMKAIDFQPGTRMAMEGNIEKTGYFINYRKNDPEHILLKFGSCEITDLKKELEKVNKIKFTKNLEKNKKLCSFKIKFVNDECIKRGRILGSGSTWTKQLGTSNRQESGSDITTDSSGNIYVTGYTGGGLDGNTSSGYRDIFLIKYNSSGTKQWTKQLGTSSSNCGNDIIFSDQVNYPSSCGSSAGNGVTTDSSGNIYVTGFTVGGLDGNTSSGYWDIFLIKYNSSGTKQWTKQLGNSVNQHGKDVTTDSSGNIYVTGYTGGGLDGNTSSGSWDIFLVKYNSSGTKQWTKQLGTSSSDFGNSVTTDSSGNIYVTGDTYGGLDGNTSSGLGDIFLVKYNSSGTKQWTKQLGTSKGDSGNGVTTDSSDNIYVTGYTSGLENYVGLDGNTSLGSTDIFLVKYNSSGTKQWTKQLGTNSMDSGNGVTTDSSGNIYVTGSTSGGLDGNTSSGSGDIFLVKYNSDGVKQ